eukprot:CAMPEP_0115042236 /NCGR_PEP_ID=MMETSP0216-20121206/46151_1 /TAXON_ID=223996 /ORGANISM="Protocruzia adherens, Strain Boccale" /LENGTH=651 /DNA_ID=CAMNT_0002424323 /DNA_START=89 /DNA_END=2041 /DNA_ORIENTATION=-
MSENKVISPSPRRNFRPASLRIEDLEMLPDNHMYLATFAREVPKDRDIINQEILEQVAGTIINERNQTLTNEGIRLICGLPLAAMLLYMMFRCGQKFARLNNPQFMAEYRFPSEAPLMRDYPQLYHSEPTLSDERLDSLNGEDDGHEFAQDYTQDRFLTARSHDLGDNLDSFIENSPNSGDPSKAGQDSGGDRHASYHESGSSVLSSSYSSDREHRDTLHHVKPEESDWDELHKGVRSPSRVSVKSNGFSSPSSDLGRSDSCQRKFSSELSLTSMSLEKDTLEDLHENCEPPIIFQKPRRGRSESDADLFSGRFRKRLISGNKKSSSELESSDSSSKLESQSPVKDRFTLKHTRTLSSLVTPFDLSSDLFGEDTLDLLDESLARENERKFQKFKRRNTVFLSPSKDPSHRNRQTEILRATENEETSGLFLENGRHAKSFCDSELLGRGRLGAFYKTRHILEDKCYAIKIIRIKLRPGQTIKDLKIWKNIQSMMDLDHQNIARYITCWLEKVTPKINGEETFITDDYFPAYNLPSNSPGRRGRQPEGKLAVYLYLQMEYCGGPQLQSFLFKSDREIDSQTRLTVFHQIVEGVKAFHQLGITHGELNPRNIFLDDDGRQVKVELDVSRNRKYRKHELDQQQESQTVDQLYTPP